MRPICRQVRSTFSDRIDGILAPSEEARVAEHLDQCRTCTSVWRRFAESLEAMREAAPPLPDGLDGRASDVTLKHRLASRRGRGTPAGWILLPLVTALLVASAVLFVRGQRPHGVTIATGNRACVDPLFDLWRVDVPGLRAPTPTRVPVLAFELGQSRIEIPAALLSRGPYRAGLTQALHAGDATCVPLLAAYGDVLVLSVANTPPVDEAGGFRVSADTRRVSYARVAWTRRGRIWTLEGRAPVNDLLALAHELAARSG